MVTGCIFFLPVSSIIQPVVQLQFFLIFRNVYNIKQLNIQTTSGNFLIFWSRPFPIGIKQFQHTWKCVPVLSDLFCWRCKSAWCVIQEIEEVFENRAHSCWIFKKLIIDCHLSTQHTPYFYRRFLNLWHATGRYFLRLWFDLGFDR